MNVQLFDLGMKRTHITIRKDDGTTETITASKYDVVNNTTINVWLDEGIPYGEAHKRMVEIAKIAKIEPTK